MAKGTFNIRPVIVQWWQTDGFDRPWAFLVAPGVAGAVVWGFKLEADNLGAVLNGATFLTGFLLTIMFQVYAWSADAAEGIDEVEGGRITQAWERKRQRRRLRAIGRLYHTLTWATLVSLTLTVVLVFLNTESEGAQQEGEFVTTTTVLAVIGVHLVVVLLAVINRLFSITGAAVKRHQAELEATTDSDAAA